MFVLFQRGVRLRVATERGHQEAITTLPERHTRQESLQRVQTHEISQPQKRKLLNFGYLNVSQI